METWPRSTMWSLWSSSVLFVVSNPLRFDDYVLMICEHEEFSLFVSIVDHSLAHGRRQLEPFGLAGWVTLQGIAEAFLISTEVQKSSKSSRINAGLSEQWGWSRRQFDSRCLLMKVLRHHPWSELWNQQSVTYHKLVVTPSCSNWKSIQCRKHHQIWLKLRERHQRASRKLHRQYTIHLLLWLPCHRSYSHSRGRKKKEAEQFAFWEVASTDSV